MTKLNFSYGDLKFSENNDDLLYYYCSMGTFVKIIKSKKIWLRNLLEMNDPSELILSKIPIHNVVLDMYKKNPFEFKYGEFEGEAAMLTFLAPTHFLFSTGLNSLHNNLFLALCLTEEEDSLTQWITYAENGKGVCLGFDKKELKKFINEDKNFTLEKIEYYSDYNNLATKIAQEIFNCIKDLAEKGDVEELKRFSGNLFVYTLPKWSKYKSSYYKKEKETRLIYRKYTDKININIDPKDVDREYISDLEVEMLNEKLDIHYELDIEKLGFTTITLGPVNNNSLENIKILLAKSNINIKKENFYKSKIPYRG